MQNCFVQRGRYDSSEFIGTITDGHYKLDVLLIKKMNDLPKVLQGTKLILIGDLQESGDKISHEILKIII